MSFASYRRVNYISCYAEAEAFLQKTKPIRGREFLVPLGARRDADKFSIKKDLVSGDITTYMYKQPVVTFLKEGGLLFTPPSCGWGVTEGWMINELLPQVRSARAVRAFMHIQLPSGESLVLPPKKATKTTNTLELVNPDDIYVWRIQRSEANKVRAEYGEFYRYLKGMVGVRKVPKHYNFVPMDEDDKPFYAIEFSPSEFLNLYPLEYWQRKSTFFRHKPAVTQYERRTLDNQPFTHADWLESASNFISLITPRENKEEQAACFYEAFLMLASSEFNPWFFNQDNTKWMYADTLPKFLDEMLFKFYSDRVFVKTKVEPGRVPDDKYRLWVTRTTIDA